MKPACMDGREYAEWQAHNQRLAQWVAPTPCHDCIAAFAVEMRMEGRCDGHPGGVEDDDTQLMHGLSDGVAASAASRRKRKLEKAARARVLYQSGVTQAEIARRLGLSPVTIATYKAQGLLT